MQKTKKKLILLGQMKNNDRTYESANRVYERKALCPTISSCGGGDRQPKVIKKWKK